MSNGFYTRKVPLDNAGSATYLAGVGMMFTIEEFITAVFLLCGRLVQIANC